MWPASCCACSRRIRSFELAAIAVGQPAGRAGRASLSRTSRRCYPRAALRSPWTRLPTLVVDAADSRRSSRAAPHGVAAALIDALLTAAEAGGHRAARRRHLGRLSLLDAPARTRRSTSTRTARRRASRSSPARCPSTSTQLHDAARRASRLLRDGGPARQRAAADARAHRAASVRRRRHGQHGLGPQAGRRHASSAASQRPVRLQRARAPPHAGDHGACAAAATGVDAEFDFVPHSGPFARGIHVTRAGGALKRSITTRGRCCARCASSTRGSPFVRVAAEPPRVKDVVGAATTRSCPRRAQRRRRSP